MNAWAPAPQPDDSAPGLVDPFGRTIDYLRLSVTDRCDLRCVYCMSERQAFLARSEVLTLDELDRLGSTFVGLGVRRLRLTGGEPLVRKDFMALAERLSRHLRTGALEELTLTTNATRLAGHAAQLAHLGIRRVNVSLDTLDAATYRRVTRGGDIDRALDGIAAAKAAGLQVKINTVALRHDNASELAQLIAWAHAEGFAISLIETMPLGDTGEDRSDQFLPLSQVREQLSAFWTFTPQPERTGGPSEYVEVAETGGRLGFITPLTHNFCAGCNRLRVTCTGTLFLCLGQDDSADLRTPLRAHPDSDEPLRAAILSALTRKPERHGFSADTLGRPTLSRPMSMTGG